MLPTGPTNGVPRRSTADETQSAAAEWVAPPRPRPLAPRLTDAEAAAHEAFIDTIGENALWRA